MMKYYDVNGDGYISYEEFISGLRDPLSSRKQKVVDRAFEKLDSQRQGKLKLYDIVEIMDVSSNAEYVAGKKSREQLISEFLEAFDGQPVITKLDWDNYYIDVAMSVPSDEYFVKLLESAWKITEDEQSVIFNDKIKTLISMTR